MSASDCNLSPRACDRKLQYGLWLLYAVFTAVLAVYHEPWRDELQAWLIARDLGVGGVWHEMRYEGHFMLWMLLLKLPMLWNGGVFWLQCWSWLLLNLAAGAVLFCSPFGKWEKLAILVSAPFICFAAVSRCYSLIPLLLCLTARLYPTRYFHPVCYGLLLALLANTHVYIEGVVMVMFLLAFDDLLALRREFPDSVKRFRAIVTVMGLTLAGVAVAALQVLPAFFQPEVIVQSHDYSLSRLVDEIYGLAFYYCRRGQFNFWLPLVPIVAGAAVLGWKRRFTALTAATAVLLIIVYGFCHRLRLPVEQLPIHALRFFWISAFALGAAAGWKCSRRFFWIWTGGNIFIILFAFFFYRVTNTNAAIFFLIAMFAVWLLPQFAPENCWMLGEWGRNTAPGDAGKFFRKLLIAFSLISLPGMAFFVAEDLRYDHSPLPKAGEFLRRLAPETPPGFFPHLDRFAGVCAYAPELKLRSVQTGELMSFFHRARLADKGLGGYPAIKAFLQKYPETGVVICERGTLPFNPPPQKPFRWHDLIMVKLYETAPAISQDENFDVFAVVHAARP